VKWVRNLPTKQKKLGGLFNEWTWQDATPKILTEVKNQGQKCAASYAFAVVAALESFQALNNQAKVNRLSE
jgi:DNA-binding MltR family transcriptional regulator